MIGALLGAGVAGLQAALQAGAQADANAINWRAVMETIRANREKEELAKADRSDPYGNKLEYSQGSGFGYDLTPITKAILGGEQREQYLGLTKDAPRNRAAAERMDERSKEADEVFNEKFNEYRFEPKANQGELTSNAQELLLNARRKGLDESASVIARQMLRGGNTSNLAGLYKQAGDDYARSLSETLLNAKRIGADDFASQEQGRVSRAGQELGMLKSIADQTTTSPVDVGTYNRDLSGRADNAVSQLASILSHNQGAMSSALGQFSEGIGKSPDLGGLSSALAALGKSMEANRGIADGGPGPKNPQTGLAVKVDPWEGMRTTTL